MTNPKFASVRTPLGYINSDSGQHQTTSLQCTQAGLVRVG